MFFADLTSLYRARKPGPDVTEDKDDSDDVPLKKSKTYVHIYQHDLNQLMPFQYN